MSKPALPSSDRIAASESPPASDRVAGSHLGTAPRHTTALDQVTTPPEKAERVGWVTLVNYSAPLAPASLLLMMVTVVYMNFATDVLLLAPGVIGTIFFASKLWDALSDPIIGYVSDRTRCRLGRRKTWLYASAIPLAGTVMMMWSPPADLAGGALLGWVVVSVLAFYTAFTIYAIPQMALGLELSPSPHERARVFAGRQIALSIGMLGAFIIATPMIVGDPSARENATLISTIGALVLALSILICTYFLPGERSESVGKGAKNPVAAIRDVVRNRHARLLLFVYFIEVFGIGATSAMTPFLLKYVIKAADYVGIVFIFYTLPAILSIPFWVWLGKRYERHKLWRFAMGLQAVGYGLIIFQDEGRIGLMVLSSIINGFATACGQTLGYAIKGDVIDYDEYLTGERKEGSYLAAWNLASKFGTGLMIAISGWALQGSGFIANQAQTETVNWTIKGMTGGAPFVCILIGMFAFSRFSLNRDEAARIRAVNHARRADQAATV
ncbi:MAG: MFS transporter [bacterium]|nr:MFS transporter [bacterium]